MTASESGNGFITIAEAKGVTPEQIGVVTKEIMSDGVPKGIATQIMGKSADGVTMITVWDDPTNAEQFVQERVVPTLKNHGIEVVFTQMPLLQIYQQK